MSNLQHPRPGAAYVHRVNVGQQVYLQKPATRTGPSVLRIRCFSLSSGGAACQGRRLRDAQCRRRRNGRSANPCKGKPCSPACGWTLNCTFGPRSNPWLAPLWSSAMSCKTFKRLAACEPVRHPAGISRNDAAQTWWLAETSRRKTRTGDAKNSAAYVRRSVGNRGAGAVSGFFRIGHRL